VPLGLGFLQSGNTSGNAVDQAWYEDSGITFQLFIILIVNTFTVDLVKVLQPAELIKHYLLAPIFKSQAKISALFKPPRMHIGELHAATVKTAAMGLMYGIIYPPAYLITAMSLLISFWGTRFGLSVWFRKPPQVDTDMLDRMIWVLAIVHGLSIAMSAIAANGATNDWTIVGGPIVASPIVWVPYMVAPLSLFKVFSGHDQLDSEDSEGDTQGIAYSEVTHKTGFELKPYECPLLEPGEDAWVAVDKVSVSKGHGAGETIGRTDEKSFSTRQVPKRGSQSGKGSSTYEAPYPSGLDHV